MYTVYISTGGNEINPSHMQVSFDDSVQSDAPWEFNPHGEIKDNVCTKGDSSIVWEEGKGNRSFTTGQLIVQEGFMLQFKVKYHSAFCYLQYILCIIYIHNSIQFKQEHFY